MPSRILSVLGAAVALVACASAAPLQERAIALSESDALAWGPCPGIFPDGCQIAVLHGDPGQPNADIFLRVPAGATLAAHTHSSAERMVLVSGGLEVVYKGQPPSMLRPGMYAYGPANLPHKAVCRSTTACTLFIAFESAVDAVAYAGPLD